MELREAWCQRWKRREEVPGSTWALVGSQQTPMDVKAPSSSPAVDSDLGERAPAAQDCAFLEDDRLQAGQRDVNLELVIGSLGQTWDTRLNGRIQSLGIQEQLQEHQLMKGRAASLDLSLTVFPRSSSSPALPTSTGQFSSRPYTCAFLTHANWITPCPWSCSLSFAFKQSGHLSTVNSHRSAGILCK
ncbi:uncharacterized protein RBU33_007357 isoform 1-T1 [Hipposideros larvatus]